MEDTNRLKTLLSKYAEDAATTSDQQELFALITNTSDSELENYLTAYLQTIQPQYDEIRRQRILNSILQQVSQNEKSKLIPLFRRTAFKWIAAACIILVTGYGLWVTVGHRSQVTGDKTQVAKMNDVPAPKETRAVITLANGQKVYLDSANNGTIAQENNVNVVKNKEGGIVYQGGANSDQRTANSPITYNTLSNPRGSKVISLTLSDGTKVWLNSESSLKYPIAFNANTREVEITGEAYFEVKHNAKQPFKVHLPNGSIVEDIGTSFNINAYTDEDNIKTTLIEGSVKVVTGARGPASRDPRQTPGMDNSITLKPGEQASIHDSRFMINHPDLDDILAWKNGMFLLDNTDLPTIMRQISRWYDVDVVYEGKVPDAKFVGGVSKNLPLSKVLELLKSNGIEIKLEGKKITVIK